MKILQKGNYSSQYEKFSCINCGSSQMEVMHDGLQNYKCVCPTCNNMVYTIESEDE